MKKRPRTGTPRSRRRTAPEPRSVVTRLGLDPEPSPGPAAERSSEPGASDRIRELVAGVDVPLALELERALERAIAGFEREHEALVRTACAVPEAQTDLRQVVLYTFLGHVLARLEQTSGRLAVERLTSALLARFEFSRQQMSAIVSERTQ